MRFSFFPQIISETPVLQKITHRYFIINDHMGLFKVPIFLVTFQQSMNFSHNFWKDLEYKIFWRSFYSEISHSMWMGDRKNGRICRQKFKNNSQFIRNGRKPQFISISHTFKRRVLTFVWLEGAVFENEVTVVVNC
jgi:hypothetical protein